MESGPAIFSGAVFALFGAGLLTWTGARLLHRQPVAQGESPVTAATVAAVTGTVALILGWWCFTRI